MNACGGAMLFYFRTYSSSCNQRPPSVGCNQRWDAVMLYKQPNNCVRVQQFLNKNASDPKESESRNRGGKILRATLRCPKTTSAGFHPIPVGSSPSQSCSCPVNIPVCHEPQQHLQAHHLSNVRVARVDEEYGRIFVSIVGIVGQR